MNKELAGLEAAKKAWQESSTTSQNISDNNTPSTATTKQMNQSVKQTQNQTANTKADKEKEHLLKLRSLIQPFDVKKEIPKRELIGGMFQRGVVSVIAGAAGVGKTWLILKTIHDLSNGGNFWNGFSVDEPRRKCLVFAGEFGADGMIERANECQYNIDPEFVKIIDALNVESQDISLLLDEIAGQENIKAIIKEVKPDIIFFDSLISFFSGDENKNKELAVAFKFLARIARKENIAVVVTHHIRKRLSSEQNKPLVLDDIIGSSVLNRLTELVIAVERNKNLNAIQVTCLKSWRKYFKSFTYKIETALYGNTEIIFNHEEIAEVITSRKTKPTPDWAIGIEAFFKGRGAKPATNKEIANALNIKDMNLLNAQLKRLCDDGIIKRNKRGIYILNENNNEGDSQHNNNDNETIENETKEVWEQLTIEDEEKNNNNNKNSL